MAIRTSQTGIAEALRWPTLDDQAIYRIAVKDASTIDSLYLHLTGEPLPAAWDPRDEDGVWIGLRMHEGTATNEVVAIMVENFRLATLRKHPEWADVLIDDDRTRRLAIRGLVAAVAEMPPGDALTQG